MAKTASSLAKFSVKQADAYPTDQTTAPVVQSIVVAPKVRRRGEGKRVGIAVRLEHEDWYRVHDLAVREHSSLQDLIVTGLSEMMKQRGLPPLSGR